MNKRTFAPEITIFENKPFIITHNEHFVGEFKVTNRKAYCRGCGRIIPNDVKKFVRKVVHKYGSLGFRLTMFSYCFDCAKQIMDEEIKNGKLFIKETKKTFRRYSIKDKEYMDKRMKEQQMIEAI